jgi:hypothetical protein
MTQKLYEQRCINQHKSHTKTRPNGDKLFRIESGLWDIFYGNGWLNTSRFRIFKLKRDKTPQLICLSGLHMSHELREQLLKECAHG